MGKGEIYNIDQLYCLLKNRGEVNGYNKCSSILKLEIYGNIHKEEEETRLTLTLIFRYYLNFQDK